jgi:hypothetical protein
MNVAEVAAVAYAAGIRDKTDLATATAIAMAESGGNPRAYNGRGRDQSYGLWQINMKPSEVGDRKTLLGITSNEQLFDPATNARAMYVISGGGKNWRPWTTWKGARYYLFLPLATAVVPGIIAGQGVAAAAGNVVEGAREAVDAAEAGVGQVIKAGKWLSDRNNMFRVAKAVVGGAMLVGAVVLVTRPAVETVTGTAIKTVAPIGKALKK